MWIVTVAVLLFSVTGLMRLHFETDILEVLPKDISAVHSLQDFSKHFSEERQVIVLLEAVGEGAELEVEDAEDLAVFLRHQWPASEVDYRSSLEERPELFAESVALLWSYAPPEDVAVLEKRLGAADELETHLEKVKLELQNSFDQQASMTQAYDPLGFLAHPVLQQMMESEMSFSSDDGRMRMLMIRHREESDLGYKADAAWVVEIRKQMDRWVEQMAVEGVEYRYQLTGGPVFNAEIGSGMELDMKGTMTLTSLLIAGLFLLMQRDVKQLLLIGGLLALTFLVTLGAAGWLIGSLNLVSVGFSAILLGLVIDYAVVIARESRHVFVEAGSGALRKMVAPSIGWAAASTALVFGVLMMSTFTGVQQLGALVTIGLLSGAGVILVVTPWYFERFPMGPVTRGMTPVFLSSRFSLLLPVVMVAISVLVFVGVSVPKVSFDLKMVEPEDSEAARAFEMIQYEFEAWSERNVMLLASADSLETLSLHAGAASVEMEGYRQLAVVESVQWPVAVIPSVARYTENREVLKKWAQEKNNLLGCVRLSGFSESGLALDRGVLEAIGRLPDEGKNLARRVADDALLGVFFDRDVTMKSGVTYFFAGRMLMAEKVTPETLKQIDGLKQWNVHATGWSILQAVLLPHVKKDFYMIFIPVACVLLLALMLVFRRWRDALISLSVLLTSLFAINALVVVTGQRWNFLSGMAIPLVVGAGIDYSIHLIFALRRFEGDWREVWNGVGKAIAFCGASTAIGFSSLMFASNKMLQSMGMLCSAGVLLTMLLSLLVIPGLWKWAHRSV